MLALCRHTPQRNACARPPRPPVFIRTYYRTMRMKVNRKIRPATGVQGPKTALSIHFSYLTSAAGATVLDVQTTLCVDCKRHQMPIESPPQRPPARRCAHCYMLTPDPLRRIAQTSAVITCVQGAWKQFLQSACRIARYRGWSHQLSFRQRLFHADRRTWVLCN